VTEPRLDSDRDEDPSMNLVTFEVLIANRLDFDSIVGRLLVGIVGDAMSQDAKNSSSPSI